MSLSSEINSNKSTPAGRSFPHVLCLAFALLLLALVALSPLSSPSGAFRRTGTLLAGSANENRITGDDEDV